jgi:alkaline phosphatase
MNAIADMYLDYQIQGNPVADIIFGGGREHFIREDRNLVAEFSAKGYQYADNWSDVSKLTRKPALALLAPAGLPSALNNPHPAPLATLAEQALKLLTPAEKGFVLMIEGSLIDWCGHDNDIACAMAEMHDFAKAVAVAKAYVDAHPDTLLIITADHETGGLSLGANNVYQWLPAVVRGVSATSRAIADELNAVSTETEALQRWQALTGIVITEQEQQQLLAERNKTQAELRKVVNELISRYSYTGWTTGGHTAADVPVLAYGMGKTQFSGFMDNTDIAKRLLQFIQQTPQ